MAKGFKHGAGGGNPINFKVVGNPQPASPKENTIWVNTDVKVTGYDFSFTQPASAKEGMVWFGTGLTSDTKFNALKKNGLQVCPIYAKQYVSGAWVDKTAKICQNQVWNGFYSEVWIVKNGIAKRSISGTMNVTQQAASVDLVGPSTGMYASYVTEDLSNHKRMTVEGTYNTDRTYLCVWDVANTSPGTDNAIAKVSLAASGATLDISAFEGPHKIGVTIVSYRTHKVTGWKLTR